MTAGSIFFGVLVTVMFGVLLLMIGGSIMDIRRARDWPRAVAVVCYANEDEARTDRSRRPRGWHVMFGTGEGPQVAQFTSRGSEGDPLPIGEFVRIAYDPRDARRVMFVEGQSGQAVAGILFCLACAGLMLLGLWRGGT